MNNTMTKTDRQQNATTENRNGHRGFIVPRVDITETKDGYLLEAEMPGVNKEGLEILLEGNELTLVGHRHEEFDGLTLLYRESNQRDYRRVFVLDPVIDTVKLP